MDLDSSVKSLLYSSRHFCRSNLLLFDSSFLNFLSPFNPCLIDQMAPYLLDCLLISINRDCSLSGRLWSRPRKGFDMMCVTRYKLGSEDFLSGWLHQRCTRLLIIESQPCCRFTSRSDWWSWRSLLDDLTFRWFDLQSPSALKILALQEILHDWGSRKANSS